MIFSPFIDQDTGDCPIIYWGITTLGLSFSDWMYSILDNLHAFGLPFITGYPVKGYAYMEARNQMVRQFLSTRASHLLHIDDDQVLPSGALTEMFYAEADVVTLHSCLRYRGYEKDYGGPWGRRDNHYINAHGRPFFGQAVMLCRRQVFETIPEPWFRPKEKNQTGELTFLDSLMEHGFTITDLPITSPHLELVAYHGAPKDARMIAERGNHDLGQHEVRVYPADPRWSECQTRSISQSERP